MTGDLEGLLIAFGGGALLLFTSKNPWAAPAVMMMIGGTLKLVGLI